MTSKLSSDAQLLDLLRASGIVKLFMVVGTREQNITEEEMPAAVHIGDDVIPTAMNIGEEVNPAAVDSDLDVLDGGFTWAEAPQYGGNNRRATNGRRGREGAFHDCWV
jgi:hypothetical protein